MLIIKTHVEWQGLIPFPWPLVKTRLIATSIGQTKVRLQLSCPGHLASQILPGIGSFVSSYEDDMSYTS